MLLESRKSAIITALRRRGSETGWRKGLQVPSMHARVVKLVDAPDSKSGSERSVGSIPTPGTK